MKYSTDTDECPHDYEALYASSVRALTVGLHPNNRLDERGAHIVLEKRFYDLMVHCKRSDPAKAKWQELRAIAQRNCKDNT